MSRRHVATSALWLCLGLAGTAWAASGSALERARDAAAQRAFSVALPLYLDLIEGEPGNVELLIETARMHGFADRNADAARFYNRAIGLDPARRDALLPSMAWQTLWGGDTTQALRLFVELSERTQDTARADALDGLGQARMALGDDVGALSAWNDALRLQPDHTGVAQRRALALLWQDRHPEAIAAFEALVRLHPGRRDLAWSLANAYNFSGQHRRAVAAFQSLGAPANDAERYDLARAWRWAGESDRAAPLLAGSSAPDSEWLRDWRVQRDLARRQWAQIDSARDRDQLRTRSITLSAGDRPRADFWRDLSVRHLSLRDANGTPSGPQLEGKLQWRLGGATSQRGTAWTSIALRASRYGDWSPLTGAAHLTWLPADRWRIDADLQREVIEAPRAVSHRVTVDTASVGVDHRPTAWWTVAGAVSALRFDDGNLRWRLNARAEHALTLSPRWVLGAEAMAFQSSDPEGPAVTGRGYWNPDRYSEWRGFTGVTWDHGRWDLKAKLGMGHARELDGFGNRSSGRPNVWELGVGYDLTPQLKLQGAFGGSGRGFGLAGGSVGYWRRHASLSLNGWF